MKILLVNKFHYRRGGSETYYFDVAEGLRRLGHEVIFFAMQGPENEPCAQEKYFVSARDYNGKTSVLDKVKAVSAITYNKEAKEKFELLLQAEKPDVIHLNLTHKQITFSILDAPSAKSIPVVFTSHDYILICPNYLMLDGEGNVCEECLDGNFRHCFCKCCVGGSRAKSMIATHEARYLKRHKTYGKLDKIIAPSEFMKTKLLEGGFPEGSVVAIQNFVTTDLLENARSETTTSREHMFLYFGRLSKEKGVDVLLKAFEKAISRLPADWTLVIAGDGPEKDAIEKQIVFAGLSNRVVMTGRLDKTEMQSYVEKAFFSIACSQWRENMPYSILESFAMGTPVIGSRIGGIPELIEDGVTGFLCEPGDVEDLAKRIIFVASLNNSKLSRMRDNCRGYVVERCNADVYIKRLVSLYGQLISEKGKK